MPIGTYLLLLHGLHRLAKTAIEQAIDRGNNRAGPNPAKFSAKNAADDKLITIAWV